MRAIKGGGGGGGGAAVTIVSTTNATITTIDTVPIPTDKALLLEVAVVGIKDDQTEKGGAIANAMYANNSGTVTRQGAVTYPFSQLQAGWEVTFLISGTNVLVRVKGAAATNVSWKCSRVTLEV